MVGSQASVLYQKCGRAHHWTLSLADTRGAHDAGMQTVWICRKRHCWKWVGSLPTDVIVESLGAVGDALGLARTR
jgi:hypothetical protein